jgi:hypothetical protein
MLYVETEDWLLSGEGVGEMDIFLTKINTQCAR